MTRSPTFSPAAETTTPPQNFGPAAPRPSPPGPMSPGSSWLHNHAYRRASLSPSRFPTICRCQVDGATRGEITMSGQLRRLEIFISSPGDLSDERKMVVKTIGELNEMSYL